MGLLSFLGLDSIDLSKKWHKTGRETVYTAEETAAGVKVQFHHATVETHEETGDRRVKTRKSIMGRFYTSEKWDFITRDTTVYDNVIVNRPNCIYPLQQFVDENTT